MSPGTGRGAAVTGSADVTGERLALDAAELRTLTFFGGLSDDQLSAVCTGGWLQVFPAGPLCREGDPARYFYMLLDGEIALSKRSGTRDIDVLLESAPGTYCGAWSPYLLDENATYENTATLTRPSRIVVLDATTLGNFLVTQYPMPAQLLIGHARGRFQQRIVLAPHDRLIQLGQLTAGLTHELNNPSAATIRAASGLRLQIARLRHRRAELSSECFSGDAMDALVDLQDRVAEMAGKAEDLTPVEKADLEEALGEWLTARGVAEPWEYAATFAEAGLDLDWMERISSSRCCAGPDSLTPVIRWLASTAETEALLTEITDASQRISALVDQIKLYSQLDRAPFSDADIHGLLDATLAMMPHRLGPDVIVVKDFDQDLPAVPCFPAWLNQVWTNLIHNALDAMADQPARMLTLRTRRDRDTVRVEVCDTGAGIPDDLLARVFDPFFTTKPFGEGIGLGLDIAARVVDHHRGSIWAESIPGNTRFITSLPLTAPADFRP